MGWYWQVTSFALLLVSAAAKELSDVPYRDTASNDLDSHSEKLQQDDSQPDLTQYDDYGLFEEDENGNIYVFSTFLNPPEITGNANNQLHERNFI